jgi:hypothetical protein
MAETSRWGCVTMGCFSLPPPCNPVNAVSALQPPLPAAAHRDDLSDSGHGERERLDGGEVSLQVVRGIHRRPAHQNPRPLHADRHPDPVVPCAGPDGSREGQCAPGEDVAVICRRPRPRGLRCGALWPAAETPPECCSSKTSSRNLSAKCRSPPASDVRGQPRSADQRWQTHAPRLDSSPGWHRSPNLGAGTVCAAHFEHGRRPSPAEPTRLSSSEIVPNPTHPPSPLLRTA